jgi:hypothetical protein
MTMRNALLLAALALAGCASRNVAWFKDGSNVQEFTQTRARCNMGVANVPLGADGWDTIARQQGYFNNCMVAEGWELRQR